MRIVEIPSFDNLCSASWGPLATSITRIAMLDDKDPWDNPHSAWLARPSRQSFKQNECASDSGETSIKTSIIGSSRIGSNHLSGAFIDDNPWGLGPPVQIASYHTRYEVLDSRDQRDGETHYLLESNRGALFHGHTDTKEWAKIRAMQGDGSEFASLPELFLVRAEYLYPRYLPSMTKFTGRTDDNMVYMKGQAIMWDSRYNHTHFADCTQQESSRCERISASQHPNLARYLGVETKKIGDEDRVTRLAYRRYSMDLNEFVLMKRLLKARHVAFLMKGIESGMRHLHKLGLVHCDLRPMNVFVTFEKSRNKVVLKEVVIGDFDASVKIGEKVSLKRASNDWWPSDAKWGVKAEPWIDEWCLNKIGKWLEEDGLGIWEFNGQEDDTVVIGTNVAW